MIIVMQRLAPKEQAEHVIAEIKRYEGLNPIPLFGIERTVIAVIGDERIMDEKHIASLPGVDSVMPILHPYKLASRETKRESTVIECNGVKIGGSTIAMMAGPCAVETEEQMDEVAKSMSEAGVKIMRGGAFKPRTTPYSFQGLGRKGIQILENAAKEHGLATISEVMDVRDVEFTSLHVDVLQIGARNMQNFDLLKEVGKSKKPVMLKRGLSATIKEFLLAAEYILLNGNQNVILCERGIRTFEDETRNTLCIATVPVIKELSHLPIVVDPSHGTGKKYLVSPMSRAAIAAGADGLLIDVHPNPEEALCDADQALTIESFKKLMEDIMPIVTAMGKSL